MEWQTKIRIEKPPALFSYATRFCFLGSCFSEEMEQRMAHLEFLTGRQAFGTLYNPASIYQAVERLRHPEPFTMDDVLQTPEGYASYAHHSRFNASTAASFLEGANAALAQAAADFAAAHVVVVTLGTAWVFRHLQSGRIVANCHKQPASLFSRELLTTSQITQLLNRTMSLGPQKTWLFTISPIRHLADGAHGNAVSKASLMVGLEESAAHRYFPAYELMMDELRDYRFYARDKCHPSQETADYIWERFFETLFDERTRALSLAMQKVKMSMEHKPRFPDSAQNVAFSQKNVSQIQEIRSQIIQVRNNSLNL